MEKEDNVEDVSYIRIIWYWYVRWLLISFESFSIFLLFSMVDCSKETSVRDIWFLIRLILGSF